MFNDRKDYIRKVFATETDMQAHIRKSSTDINDQISIDPEDGHFLQLLIRLGGIKNIIEIGTLAGYAASFMAEALPEGGKIITIEKDPRRAEMARKNLAKDHRINVIEGDAITILPDLSKDTKFDMIFIDADKLNYLNYLEWAEKNIRCGGLIVGDNTFLFDAVWNDAPIKRVRNTARQAMRKFNERLSDRSKYSGLMLPTQEGMTVAIKLF